MNRRASAVGAALILLFGCEAGPPSDQTPPSALRPRNEPLPMLESEEKALLDFVTALREIKIELKRLELEWDPEARASIVERHREDLEAVHYRIRSIREEIEERQPEASHEFQGTSERVEQELLELEGRADVLEAAIALNAKEDEARAGLPRVY